MCMFGCSIQTCIPDGHLNSVTYIRYPINTIDSPDDEHRGPRNMWRNGINIQEKRILSQFGYLQELSIFISHVVIAKDKLLGPSIRPPR